MSKVLWTSADIAKATGGAASNDFSITGLSIDTRTIEKGGLFVPLKDVRDGHDFIPMAMEKGAGGTLSEKPVEGNAVIVSDIIITGAFRSLWRVCRKRLSLVSLRWV